MRRTLGSATRAWESWSTSEDSEELKRVTQENIQGHLRCPLWLELSTRRIGFSHSQEKENEER
jgi:hypothetical protein